MLGKLLKYDFRSMWKQFALLWPAVLVLALINRFTLSRDVGNDAVSNMVTTIPVLVFVSVMIAMFVIVLLYVIQRFYKGLLGDEGYLMHTLPVKTWQLIASKLICAVVMTIISIAVAVLAFLILVPFSLADLQDVFPDLLRALRLYGLDMLLVCVEILLLFMVCTAQSYLHLYLSMALGHLASKHRVAMSVLAYIGINVVGSILLNVLAVFNFDLDFNIVFDSAAAAFHAAVWFAIGVVAVICAVLFFFTNYILKRNLNLE